MFWIKFEIKILFVNAIRNHYDLFIKITILYIIRILANIKNGDKISLAPKINRQDVNRGFLIIKNEIKDNDNPKWRLRKKLLLMKDEIS